MRISRVSASSLPSGAIESRTVPSSRTRGGGFSHSRRRSSATVPLRANAIRCRVTISRAARSTSDPTRRACPSQTSPSAWSARHAAPRGRPTSGPCVPSGSPIWSSLARPGQMSQPARPRQSRPRAPFPRPTLPRRGAAAPDARRHRSAMVQCTRSARSCRGGWGWRMERCNALAPPRDANAQTVRTSYHTPVMTGARGEAQEKRPWDVVAEGPSWPEAAR